MLNQMRKASQIQCWWEAPIDELGMHELEQLRVSMEELKKSVAIQADKLSIKAANPSPFFMNGIGNSDHFERKPTEICAAPTIPHVYNFGYGHGFF
ncbi:hypothetical protein L1049_015924 [Liquidambar formosana]|uniref:Uncharacterized protein n=1 Tax=Liquidambar formosana TaxID=63359 RepID=A0AAP0S0J2_LIQFO